MSETENYDMYGKLTPWPLETPCPHEGCTETAWIVEDEGGGYVAYECPTHGSFAVQYDDPDEDYDPDLDFGQEFDPYEGSYEDDLDKD